MIRRSPVLSHPSPVPTSSSSLSSSPLEGEAGRGVGLQGFPELVGILNVTPDSFYDGGRYASLEDAVRRGRELFEEGAAWVDVGGMSTRPGSEEIPVEEEIRRVVPVIRELMQSRPESVVSVDTFRAAVAEAALDAGASRINEVAGFSLDPASLGVAARAGCPVVINHMKGTPRDMQRAPVYENLWEELLGFFESKIDAFVKAGGDESNILLDPGIGFGKTLEHNIEILRNLDNLHALARPIFLGCSRKSFIHGIANCGFRIADLNSQSAIRNPQSPEDRLPGSLAAAAWAAGKGVRYLRVHDVAETAQFFKVWSVLSSPLEGEAGRGVHPAGTPHPASPSRGEEVNNPESEIVHKAKQND
ncbi:dihydropteroate synthase [bacterium]|nr:dihydropteroate synthase [bacterium]